MIQEQTFTHGQRLRPVRAYLLDAEGKPLDLATIDNVHFRLADANHALIITDQLATKVNNALGEVAYAWGPTDFNGITADAWYWAKFKITIGTLTDLLPAGNNFRIYVAAAS